MANVFTIAQAITRIDGAPINLFWGPAGAFTSGQKLQRINQILEIWYESASWSGVRSVQSLTSTSGIISLDAAYLRAEQRFVVTTDGKEGSYFEIKPLEFQYQENGPGYFDVAENCLGVAIDMGENSSGVRRYQLTGNTTDLDALAYKAVLRKRYVWATDTATTVIPDCFAALELSIRAMNAQDEQAYDAADRLWAQAFQKLDENLGQFNEGNDMGVMQIDPLSSQGTLYNAV